MCELHLSSTVGCEPLCIAAAAVTAGACSHCQCPLMHMTWHKLPGYPSQGRHIFTSNAEGKPEPAGTGTTSNGSSQQAGDSAAAAAGAADDDGEQQHATADSSQNEDPAELQAQLEKAREEVRHLRWEQQGVLVLSYVLALVLSQMPTYNGAARACLACR